MPATLQSSRSGRWRAASLATVYVLMGIHFAHWKIAGRTLAPLELNEVLHTLHLGIVTVGFIFMAAAVLATGLVGRFFCSWGCHILALEDLCAWLLARIGFQPKPVRSRVLLWVPPLAMAYLFIWPQLERLWHGQEQPLLRVVTDPGAWTSFTSTNLWRNLPGPWIALLTFAICGFAIVYLLGSRSFCRYVCPYGAIFAAADHLAPGRIVAGGGDCIKCGRCAAICKSHVRVFEEVGQFGTVMSSSCLKDLDCVDVCPKQALRYGFTRPSLFRAWSMLGRRQRQYSFSLAEDLLMAATFVPVLVIFRGLYDAVPLLLALALAVIFAFFAVLSWRLLRHAQVRLHNFKLKVSGRWTAAGSIFAAGALLLGMFTAHSAFIRYHSFVGQQAFDELASRRSKMTIEPDAKTGDRAAATTALTHLNIVSRWGLTQSPDLHGRLASLHELTGSPTVAVVQLRALLAKKPHAQGQRLHLAKLLLQAGRFDAATDELQQIIDDGKKKGPLRNRQLQGAAHAALGDIGAQGGRHTDAIGHYEQAVRENPENAEAYLVLGVLCAATGQLDRAEESLSKSARLQPNSAAVHNNLGVLLVRLKRDTEAIDHYRKSLGLKPDNPLIYHNLGMLHDKLGQYDEAAAAFQAALDLRPDDASARAGLTMVRQHRSDLDPARPDRQEAAEFVPRSTHRAKGKP